MTRLLERSIEVINDVYCGPGESSGYGCSNGGYRDGKALAMLALGVPARLREFYFFRR